MATIHFCGRCGFPMVQAMTSRSHSTETVFACLNCKTEEPVNKKKE